jgi:hypothetical protein
VIVKRPALSILWLRGHGALLSLPAGLDCRSRSPSADRMPASAPQRCSLGYRPQSELSVAPAL